MNWLEIGCPYCPTVLTVPRAAAGRNVRCPECGKSYIVPEPKHASSAAYEVTTPLPMLPASMDEVEFEELAAAAVAKPAAVAAAPTIPQAAPPSPSPSVLKSEPPAHPLPKHPAPNVAPVAEAAIPSSSSPQAASVNEAAAPAPSAPPVAPRVRLRPTADDLMYPELEKDSPLPVLEILPPPTLNGSHARHKPVPSSPPPSDAPAPTPPPARDDSGTATVMGSPVPLGPPSHSAADPGDSEEVKRRILRERRRALISLATFVVGVLVMTAFAFLVVRFSRPS